jgi:hypothetical protein
LAASRTAAACSSVMARDGLPGRPDRRSMRSMTFRPIRSRAWARRIDLRRVLLSLTSARLLRKRASSRTTWRCVPDRTVNQGDSRSHADKWASRRPASRQRRTALAISHRASDFHDEKTWQSFDDPWTGRVQQQFTWRIRDQVARSCGGKDLLEPGLVPGEGWRTEPGLHRQGQVGLVGCRRSEAASAPIPVMVFSRRSGTEAESRPIVGVPRSGRVYPTKPRGIASAMVS